MGRDDYRPCPIEREMNMKTTAKNIGRLTPDQANKVKTIIDRAEAASKRRKYATSFAAMILARAKLVEGPSKISDYSKYITDLEDAGKLLNQAVENQGIISRDPSIFAREFFEDTGQILSEAEQVNELESRAKELQHFLSLSLRLFDEHMEAGRKNRDHIKQALRDVLHENTSPASHKKAGRPRIDRRRPYKKNAMRYWLGEFYRHNPEAAANEARSKALSLFDPDTGDPAYNNYRPPWGPRQFFTIAQTVKREITGKNARK